MHPVAAQQKPVMQGGGLGEVIQLHIRLHAQGAGELIAFRSGADMVAGKLGQIHLRGARRAQAIGAAVPGMKDIRHPSAQDQRGEGGPHANQRRIAMALAIDPAIQRGGNGGGGALHRHGLGHVAKAVEKAAHRGFRRHPSPFGAADAVGQHGHHIAARRRQFPAEHRAGEILIVRPCARIRKESGAGPHA